MTICRACSGEAVKVQDGRAVRRSHDECVAQSLIKHKNNPFGIMSFEHAARLCSCLKNKHQGEINLPPDEIIDTINKKLNKKREVIEAERPVNIYDQKRQADIDYYQQRILEVKQRDSEEGSPEWSNTLPEETQHD